MNTCREWDRLADSERELIKRNQLALPVKVGAIAKELGINVNSATLPAGISGEIKDSPGGCIIRINRHDPKERQRFTVAHEIAHFLLHREFIGDGIVDDILYRSALSSDLEAQANRLAADIIMPWSQVQKRMQPYVGLKLEEKIQRLANDFEVSTTAIKIRLGKL